VGQLKVFNHFSEDRLAHAYILLGNSTDELKEAAWQTAQWVNCLAEDEAKRPCNSCENCIKIQHNVHRDCFWIEPQGAAQQIQIEQIRGMQRDIAGAPTEGKMKIVMIAAAHRMNEQSQNCLLKTLEEPPDNTLLLLLTDNPGGLLPTVQSRCQMVSLKGGLALPPLQDFELAEVVLGDIFNLDYEGVFARAAALEKFYKKDLKNFFAALEILFRDSLIGAAERPERNLEKLKQSPLDIIIRGETVELQKALEAVWHSAYLIERNVNVLLLLENLFLNLRKLNLQIVRTDRR